MLATSTGEGRARRLVRPSGDLVALLALTLAALAPRVWRLDLLSLRGDESFAVWFATLPLREMLRLLGVSETHPPIYYVTLRYWMRLAGDADFTVRYLSVLFGVLLVPLTYSLARSAGLRRAALPAALLAAANPFLLWHSQDTRMYTMATAFALASLRFATALLSGEASVEPAGVRPTIRRRWPAYAAYVVATLLALHTHYGTIYAVAAENAAALLALALIPGFEAARRLGPACRADIRAWVGALLRGAVEAVRARPGPVVGWLAAQGIVVGVSLGWWIYAAPLLAARTVGWLQPLTPWELLRRAWVAYSLGPNVRPELAWPLVLAFLPATLAGLVVCLRTTGGIVVLTYVLAPLAGAYLTSLVRPLYEPSYFLFVAPAYAVALGAGLADLRTRSHALAGLALVLVLGSTGFALGSYYLDPQQAKSPDWRNAAASIVGRWQPGDLLVVNYPDPSLSLYVHRLAASRGVDPATRSIPTASPVTRQAVEEALRGAAGEHGRIWLVPIRAPEWDSEGLVQSWLDDHAQLADAQRFRGLELRLYATPRGRLEAHPRQAPVSFGGFVEFLGYDVGPSGSVGSPGPTVVEPGDDLWLTLYFRATQPVPLDLTVYNHLLDPNGETRGQHDGQPVDGRYQTTAWRVGEIVMDRHRIPVPPSAPPGAYQVMMGLYNRADMRRVPVLDATGADAADGVVIPGIEVVGR